MRAALLEDEALAKKPEAIRAQIVEGQLRKWFEEVCLLDQPSIHAEHSNKTIGQVVLEAGKSVGGDVALKAFVRYALGEGIEKADAPDFAAEVASMAR